MIDPRALLARPKVFGFFNTLIGVPALRRLTVERFIRPKAGDRILDIGCGTAEILAYLPEGVSYEGTDADARYIDAARRRYGRRGHFMCQSVTAQSQQAEAARFDVVLALGVLHHLDDAAARDLLRLAKKALKPEGRLITMDGCFTPHQPALTRYMLRRDRGVHVRTEAAYLALAREAFPSVKTHVFNGLLRLPYTHLFMECC